VQRAVVQFSEGGERYLGVVTSHWDRDGGWPVRSLLTLFRPTGQVVYEEILEATTGICALTGIPGEKNRLLVGNGKGRVYSYEKIDGQ
jgi:hypothetical protein